MIRMTTKHEYKVLFGRPGGFLLFPWASRKLKETIGPHALETQLKKLAADGWEIITCTSASHGSFLYVFSMVTIVLRREVNVPTV
jgi:hypothetical protein